MMSKLLVQASVRTRVENVIKNPVQALGLQGYADTGKRELSEYIAASVLGHKDIKKYPYVKIIDCKSGVGIEAVREAIIFLTLKIPGNERYKRALIFWSFEELGIEAQNAFLKSLEEPPSDTLIIITTDAKNKVLPTIGSRLSWVNVLPVSHDEALDYFNSEFKEDKIETAYLLSGGRPARLRSLLNDYEKDPLVGYIQTAKRTLSQDRFARLAEVESLSKDKEIDILMYLEALAKILQVSVKTQIESTGTINRKTLFSLESIISARESINRNANKKLVLTEVFYNL